MAPRLTKPNKARKKTPNCEKNTVKKQSERKCSREHSPRIRLLTSFTVTFSHFGSQRRQTSGPRPLKGKNNKDLKKGELKYSSKGCVNQTGQLFQSNFS